MRHSRLRTIRTTAIGAGLAVFTATALGSGLWPSAQAAEAAADVWLTTADQTALLEQQPSVPFGSGGGGTVIEVDADTSYQVMDGFGASFTDSAAWLVHDRLDRSRRDELMRNLFDPDSGIGLSMVRQPLGASDFTVGGADYTYDDTCCDAGDFSIDHDRDYIVPLLRQAKSLNPEVKIVGTPWSAPAWMKTNGSLFGGRLASDRFDDYADYLARFVAAYEAEGLPIYALTPQNEPHHESSTYPTMRMSWQDQAAFVGDHLGPALEGSGTAVIAWDHNWDEPDYAVNVLNDPEANRYLAGSAFHCYAGDVSAQQQVHDAHPDKGLWFTECSGGEWATDFAGNLKWNTQNLIIGATRNWAKSVTLWNMALDQDFGPTNGGCADCRGVVTVDTQTGRLAYNVEYYVLGHVSKFVRPGAVRVDSTTRPGGIETVAFKNPDGTIALLALNAGASAADFTVSQGDRQFGYRLPAGAVATFTWSEGRASEPPGGEIDPRASYAIESAHSGKVLDVTDASAANGALIQQWDDFGAANQRWRFESTGDGYWRIVSLSSGKVLDVTDASTANGALIRQWDAHGGVSQQWSVTPLGEGTFSIINRRSGKALDVKDVSAANGASIQQWDHTGGANQRWRLAAD
ncbi:RICIN domain-containing protein [Glycomyces tarimensis]